jgi:hypothetical protein
MTTLKIPDTRGPSAQPLNNLKGHIPCVTIAHASANMLPVQFPGEGAGIHEF